MLLRVISLLRAESVQFLLKKLSSFILLILILTSIALGLQSLRGGSAALATSGQRASAAEIARQQKELGEDRPFLFQLTQKLESIVTLDFGTSVKEKPVMPMVLEAFQYTAILASLAALLALLYAVILATLGMVYPSLGRILDRVNYFLLANPVFILALLLIWLFSIGLGILPPGGTQLSFWYVLPALALGLKAAARLSIFITEFLKQEQRKPYVLTLHAYGFSKGRIYGVYILKNIALPALSFWLIDFASYLAGAAIVETMHSIPGIGSLLLKALFSYDINVIIGVLAFTSIFIFGIGIIQELLDEYYKKFSGGQT